MKKTRKLASYHSLEVEIVRKPDDELLGHLENTVLGTPGRLRYKHTTIKEKLAHIGEVYFMLLKKAGRLLGSVGMARRKTINNSKEFKSWYIRYFSVRAPLRARKLKGDQQARQVERSMGLLKGVAEPYFANPDRLEFPEKEASEKSFIYAYIEDANYRSRKFSEYMGMNTIRTFTTLLFSRFHTALQPGCRQILNKEQDHLIRQLKSFYSGHNMFSLHNIFHNNNYFVMEEGDEIVAGLQATPDEWCIVEKEGFSGWILLKALPRIPGMKSFFNPEKFRFVGIEGIWVKAGYEHQLQKLIEHVCAHFKIAIAMMWFDTDCPVLKLVEDHVSMGFIPKVMKPVEASVCCRFIGFQEDEIEEFKTKPVYLSAFDMM